MIWFLWWYQDPDAGHINSEDFLWFLVIVLVPILTMKRCIASLLFLIINSSVATTLFTWRYSIQANIKLLTIVWMGKFRMIDNHSSSVNLTFFRTFETIFQFFVYYSTSLQKYIKGNIYFSTSAVRPYTRATIFIEVQSSGTRNFDSFAVNAIVKDITDRRIWMSEETVSSRTLLGRLRWFCTSKRNITVILKALSLFLVIESCMSRTLTAKANDVTCRTRAAQFYSNEYFQYLIQIFIARI